MRQMWVIRKMITCKISVCLKLTGLLLNAGKFLERWGKVEAWVPSQRYFAISAATLALFSISAISAIVNL